jgi:Tol biopolymer transport system component
LCCDGRLEGITRAACYTGSIDQSLRRVHMIQRLFLKLFFATILFSVSSVYAAGAVGRLPTVRRHELTFYSRRDGNFDVYLADTDRALVVNFTRHPDEDMRPAWSPNGEELVFYSTQGTEFQTTGLYTMDADGRGRQLLADSGFSQTYPSWSPDGRTITYSSNRSSAVGIFNIDVADGTRQQVNTYRASLLAHSPDGRQIVFMASCENNCDIFVMDADGGNVRPITRNGVFDVFPAWSPDSRQIAFMSNRNLYFEIYVADVECATAAEDCEGTARQLTENRDFDGFPVWSPDGRRLLYSSDRNGNFELYTVETMCGAAANHCEAAARRLTDQPSRDISPAWSPDGRSIAFISGRDVYVMDADGGNIRHIMDDVLPDQFLVWRP